MVSLPGPGTARDLLDMDLELKTPGGPVYYLSKVFDARKSGQRYRFDVPKLRKKYLLSLGHSKVIT